MRVDNGRSKIAHRTLPVADMLAEAARFTDVLGAEDDIPLCIGALSDGTSIDAPDLAQLHADLDNVADEHVTHLSIGIGSPSTTQIWLSREPDPSSDSGVATLLRVVGEDEAQADMVFAVVSRDLDERLHAADERERQQALEQARREDARREAAEAAAHAKAEAAARSKAGDLSDGDPASTKRKPKTWELWAVGVTAAVTAMAILVVATLLIH
ncbi:MAG: hypothetical protein ACR2NB_04955 [Solirubrobacteraceae bacterium]